MGRKPSRGVPGWVQLGLRPPETPGAGPEHAVEAAHLRVRKMGYLFHQYPSITGSLGEVGARVPQPALHEAGSKSCWDVL